MSFGFSAGDFIAAATLINRIISALNKSSTAEYNELLLELHGLQRALDELEHLDCTPERQPDLNAVKAAALMCQYRLDDFANKLKRFQSLGADPQKANGGRINVWRAKLQWGFCMRDEVRDLRAYLIGHVGSLNMRLTILNLQSTRDLTDLTRGQATATHSDNGCGQFALDGSQEDVTERSSSLHNQLWTERLMCLINGCSTPQVALIIDLVRKVWVMNTQIVELLMEQRAIVAPPDTRYTWYQKPVRFEDALGNILPVPSEYNCGKIRAIILDQFKGKPGCEKVACGEYELFNAADRRHVLSDSELELLVPGMSITMAFVIGLYVQQPLEGCPRPGCRAGELVQLETGGKRCSTCSVWFDTSRTKIPRPFRLPPVEDVFKHMRTERKWFKNVMLCPADLPSLPLTADNNGFFSKSSNNAEKPPGDTGIGTPALPVPSPKIDGPGTDKQPTYDYTGVINPEAVGKVLTMIADVFDMSIQEFREAYARESALKSLGMDSLMRLMIMYNLEDMGINAPDVKDGPIIRYHDLEGFIRYLLTHNGSSYPWTSPIARGSSHTI